ncbi:hypothetical protein HBH56_019690 [Parastagonospora nodorum]|uniref:Uncharacterized protein n=1 Tax=Phaeosphaeria nodorum (strain SN15 / ATCC MYA-4574 / FGSC 10173) TaxID=321614 RepID=A0A7U2HYT5_PHANO|nr:hypothetical protein HBH56_019690 [Parastagonospora nodorum]QRC95369.1 hypothetical protein JI435_302280 [Parastagonospora nodorum SN15]KAH3936810.1 hypothetical protein HBH54_014810 [Parastagonospora nodorum]KAH3962644.1 hypothetical protein HBH51_174840 [Parastagonospora nodorum]KAH4006766.1 hypothetical protein HBI10_014680 [Parastagonospora nodorum]
MRDLSSSLRYELFPKHVILRGIAGDGGDLPAPTYKTNSVLLLRIRHTIKKTLELFEDRDDNAAATRVIDSRCMETASAHCGSPISQLCITSRHRDPILGCTVSSSGSRALLRHQLIVAARPKALRTIERAGEYLQAARCWPWNAMRCFARCSMQPTARWHAAGPM